MKIMHHLKMIFNTAYREKFIKSNEMRTVGYGEVIFNIVSKDESTDKRQLSIIFKENDLGERAYTVKGSSNDKTFYWNKLKAYHEAELWVESGLKPSFYEDILVKKLSS